ncbi:radical SAM family heme chaperone HemW [Helicobacter sp. 23-1045]
MLYIHIPFCASKCGYCGFNSMTNMLNFKQKYLNALCADLKNEIDLLTFCHSNQSEKSQKFHSIYIGGGTPNTLNPSDYERIFRILEPKIAPNTEITMELNPNVSSIDTLNAFKDLGVNRFSIGAQSFCDDKLRLLERTHSPKIARKFIESALKCGVKTSIDLIYDTILDSPKRLRFELESALNLGVGHISCYTLSIDKNSAFFANGKNPTRESSLCYELKEFLDLRGFRQYEVSNFARDDLQKSRHNLGYWAYRDYIGVGLGAVGKRARFEGDLQVARIYKQSDFGAYLANPLSVRCEILSQSDIRLEKIFLGFRSEVGVNPALIANQNRLKILLDSDKIRIKNGKIYATNYFIADEMALFLG